MKSDLVSRMSRRSIIFVILLSAAIAAQSVSTLTAPFNASGGVSVNDAGEIFVADFGAFLNNANGTTVYKVNFDGSVEVFATGLLGASGNDFDSQGNLFQSNIGASKISKITPDGTVSDFASVNITAPVGIAITTGDTVYVANCASPGWITRVTPLGVSTILATSSLLSCPNGLTIDDDGVLYACNFNNGDVIRIEQTGALSVLATVPGANNGHITFANGRLYVVGRCGNRIYEVSLAGVVTLIAGSGARGNADGSALQASFSIPNGIAASPDGNVLYINSAVPLDGGCFGGSLNQVVLRMIELETDGIEGRQTGQIPAAYQLEQNYPNPFNPETVIRYSLSAQSDVQLEVFDTRGQRVKTAIHGQRSAGNHAYTWDGRDEDGRPVSSGVYLYSLAVKSATGPTGRAYYQTRKMVLLR